jgi:hypothetical protein
MSDENKNNPKPEGSRNIIEKGVKIDLNESKLPDFKFTPPPPPPPPQANDSSGDNANKISSE